MENKHKIVLEWLSTYPELEQYLFFNATREELNNTSMNTVVSDTWETRYIRDKGIKNYDFAITMMKYYDDGTNENNTEELFDVQKFMIWIEEQNKIKNFPIFEEGEVISVENLQNIPNLAGISEDEILVKYMFQIRLKYIII